MRCSPDNCHRRRLCAKWETSVGGTGTDRLPARQLPPAPSGGGKTPSRSPAMVPMGSPGCGTGGSSVVWGSAPARWAPCGCQAPALRGNIPPSAYGDRAGPGTPSLGTGLGCPVNLMALQQHRQRLSRQLPLLMLIRASLREWCKISPQRGFCVLGEGGWAGGAPSIHLPLFPPFFVSQRS